MLKFEMLDESEPYGEVFGASIFKYEQCGKFFDVKKRRVNPDGSIFEPEDSLAEEDLTVDAVDVVNDAVVEKVVVNAAVKQVQKNKSNEKSGGKKIVLPKRLES